MLRTSEAVATDAAKAAAALAAMLLDDSASSCTWTTCERGGGESWKTVGGTALSNGLTSEQADMCSAAGATTNFPSTRGARLSLFGFYEERPRESRRQGTRREAPFLPEPASAMPTADSLTPPGFPRLVQVRTVGVR